uniref:PRO1737 n=1 Tax=Homo sapiens TaxID=9606 RepID=Q9H393_HUMAN|nr:PRO1737 [Homo sapiens]
MSYQLYNYPNKTLLFSKHSFRIMHIFTTFINLYSFLHIQLNIFNKTIYWPGRVAHTHNPNIL